MPATYSALMGGAAFNRPLALRIVRNGGVLRVTAIPIEMRD